MSIIWNKIFANQTALRDFVYNTLKALEAGGVANWLQPKPMGGTSGITIGIGFDLKNCLRATRLAVLQAMGLQTNLLKENQTSLSASEKIEVDYINRLYNAVQGNSIAAVNTIMAERANDAALKAAMAAENKNYELRSSFYFKDESEVRWAYDNGGFDDYSNDVNNRIGSTISRDPNFILSQERAALVVVDWLRPALVPGTEIKDGDRAEAWFKIRYGWPEGTGDNEQYNNGWAKRHYLESQIFGLYNNPDNVSLTEARSVYQMFQSNRKKISDREKQFGEKFDGTNGTRNMISEGNSDSNYQFISLF